MSTTILNDVQIEDAKQHLTRPLATPTDLCVDATKEISGALTAILADVFAIYMKTKNFHWHMSGAHFRDYHLMLDEQSAQLFAMTDDIAERARKIGGRTIRSIGEISRMQRILDNDADYVEPADMLAELCEDNKQLAAELRAAHILCDERNDFSSVSMIDNWIDETERRVWFLYESYRH
ncbi:DNA starvation/stationary phase protection protein [Photobacterium phosphoreum]|jgi:starvation-inducible DNA-binding protein|uniref:DNA starvation/stationary phase protection protein n=2 Tax=Photobacterium phosphoreum TaxID=659 RepID=A0A2T3JWT0_PHOPO|nr:DNA starvation/stationary phase protection protein [Photobacterium phosphoreum]KJF87577.1 DNA-binding protein [Photobacterium phosphoreum]MCD9462065.1 DNA starvation/stationary phase protection protein [Photobacterium phosphoreum]MCD9469370.1 DNA starvation/stationary phase protection protein [Photobacterium phosphoreum]MCD9475419.1 DNA starvation/stationary phase protection protein [Photobacterium phosphoreum]MCD9480446.1 DNA starvation/stationary phase protection protein [Photobacterium p